jgi:hypothetical protein
MTIEIALALMSASIPLTALIVKMVPKRVIHARSGPTIPVQVSEREFVELKTRVDVGFRVIQEALNEIKDDLRGIKRA